MRFSVSDSIGFDKGGKSAKAERIAALRRAVGSIHPVSVWAGSDAASAGIASLRCGLPGSGFPCGVLNEIIASYRDQPAAFSFLFAVMAAALRERDGLALFIAAQRALDIGVPYGHGLCQLGVDASRLVLVETKTDKDALWAVEEALRSGARPAVVAGAIGGQPDLTQSRRLNLAAAAHATPLVLTGGTRTAGTSAAATRWRIGPAPAAFDRFGMLTYWRWHATLERCRNGRTGKWLIEWDPAQLHFRTKESLPDQAHVRYERQPWSTLHSNCRRSVRRQSKHPFPEGLDLADVGDAPRRQKAI